MNHSAPREPPGLPTALLLLLLLLLCGNPFVVSVFACVCVFPDSREPTESCETEGACVVMVHYLCVCI